MTTNDLDPRQLWHRTMQPFELSKVAGLLAAGMRDNPLHIAVFGNDAQVRRRSLQRMFETLLRVGGRRVVGTFHSERLVGVLGSAEPGGCQISSASKLRIGAAVLPSGPAQLARLAHWQHAWQAREPVEPHEHFGPFAVDPDWQGRRIGSNLIAAHVDALDSHGWTSYLETDKWANVELYQRHGYQVEDEAVVLNVCNWFLRRYPHAA